MVDYTDDEKHALRIWALAKGSGHYRRSCFACADQRKNRKASTLSVEIDFEKALFTCFHCDAQGAVRLEPGERHDDFTPAPKPKPTPKGVIREMGVGLDAMTRTYLKGRGISEATAIRHGVTYAVAYFPELRREELGLAFPYIDHGRTQGHKVRTAGGDKANVCDTTLATLCGLELVNIEESSDIIICEGEIDMLSFTESGISNATSVPNGASSFSRSEKTDTKTTMAFLWSAKEKIDKAKRIIIASDGDEPGNKLAEELARRIGKHRCWQIEYPEDRRTAMTYCCNTARLNSRKWWNMPRLGQLKDFMKPRCLSRA